MMNGFVVDVRLTFTPAGVVDPDALRGSVARALGCACEVAGTPGGTVEILTRLDVGAASAADARTRAVARALGVTCGAGMFARLGVRDVRAEATAVRGMGA